MTYMGRRAKTQVRGYGGRAKQQMVRGTASHCSQTEPCVQSGLGCAFSWVWTAVFKHLVDELVECLGA